MLCATSSTRAVRLASGSSSFELASAGCEPRRADDAAQRSHRLQGGWGATAGARAARTLGVAHRERRARPRRPAKYHALRASMSGCAPRRIASRVDGRDELPAAADHVVGRGADARDVAHTGRRAHADHKTTRQRLIAEHRSREVSDQSADLLVGVLSSSLSAQALHAARARGKHARARRGRGAPS